MKKQIRRIYNKKIKFGVLTSSVVLIIVSVFWIYTTKFQSFPLVDFKEASISVSESKQVRLSELLTPRFVEALSAMVAKDWMSESFNTTDLSSHVAFSTAVKMSCKEFAAGLKDGLRESLIFNFLEVNCVGFESKPNLMVSYELKDFIAWEVVGAEIFLLDESGQRGLTLNRLREWSKLGYFSDTFSWRSFLGLPQVSSNGIGALNSSVFGIVGVIKQLEPFISHIHEVSSGDGYYFKALVELQYKDFSQKVTILGPRDASQIDQTKVKQVVQYILEKKLLVSKIDLRLPRKVSVALVSD